MQAGSFEQHRFPQDSHGSTEPGDRRQGNRNDRRDKDTQFSARATVSENL